MRWSLCRPRWRRASALLAAVLVLQPLLAGCGGGGGSSLPPPTNTVPDIPVASASGTVTRAEIGGQGLTIRSAWQTDASVAGDGAYSTQVSQAGAQLLLATDADGAARGLAISVPAGRGRQAADLTVDARSTALALLFLSPGVLTTDPAEAAARLADLGELAALPALLDFLRARLPSTTIGALLADAGYSDLIGACVDEWQAARAEGRAGGVHPQVESNAKLRVVCTDSSNPAQVKMRLSNDAFRFVAISRADRNADGEILRVAQVGFLKGATGASWGGFFTDRAFKPATLADTADLSQVVLSEYWATGPGWAPHNEEPPGRVDPNPPGYDDEFGCMVVYYLVFPFIDLLLGGHTLLDKGWTAAKVAWNSIKGSVNIAKLTDPGSQAAFWAAVIDTGRAMLGFLGPIADGLLSAGVISAGTAAAIKGLLGKALALSSVVFSIGNLSLLIGDWAGLPDAARLVVKTSGDVVIELE